MSKLAVITGASSGIGAEFARQLAVTYKIMWLIGRREEKLQALADSLREQHGVDARVMLMDLSDDVVIDKLGQELEKQTGLEMLVNNAGYAEDGAFHELEWKKHQAIMNVHLQTTLKLSHAALATMVRNDRGSIINVASVASFIPTPSSPLYGPTKAFLLSFTQSLAGAYQDTGLKFQALCPGFTVTDFHEKIGLNPREFYKEHGLVKSWTAEYVVRKSLNDLDRNVVVSVPGWNYKFIVMLVRRLPLSWLLAMVSRGNKSHRYSE